MQASGVDVVKRSYEAFGRRDFDAVRETYAPDFEVAHGLRRDAATRDVEGAVRYLEDLCTSFSEFAVEPEEFLDAGDHVIALGTVRGRNEHGRFAIPFATVFTIEGGKIVRLREYMEPDAMLRCHDVPPPPPPKP